MYLLFKDCLLSDYFVVFYERILTITLYLLKTKLNEMKRVLLLIAFLALSFQSNVFADEPITIPIIPESGSSTIRPYSEYGVSFCCTYSQESGILCLDYSEDAGSIVIKVTNETTTECAYGFGNSFGSSLTMKLCGSSGSYTIQITTGNGDVYSGRFELQ